MVFMVFSINCLGIWQLPYGEVTELPREIPPEIALWRGYSLGKEWI